MGGRQGSNRLEVLTAAMLKIQVCDVGYVIHGASEDHIVPSYSGSIRPVSQVLLDCLTLKMMAVQYFETSETM
jgi:hypothetical protein